MNIANMLTFLRAVLSPLIIFVMVSDFKQKHAYALILFLVASYTDYLDGKIARKTKSVSNFGKIADPLADKILIIPILLCFSWLNLVNIWPVSIICAREVLLTLVRFLSLNDNKKIISANIFGKLKMVLQTFSIIFIFLVQIFKNHMELNLSLLYSIQNILVWISAMVSIISGFIYINSNFRKKRIN